MDNDILTEDVLESYNNSYPTEDIEKIADYIQMIDTIFDDNIIPHTIPCNNMYEDGIPPTNYYNLYDAYNKQFYNYELLQNILCRYSGQLLTWNEDLGLYGNIKNLGILKHLSTKGANSVVYSNELEGKDNYFIVKTTEGFVDYTFKTEAIISFIMSGLRKKIPNFVMTFGAFISKEPMDIDDDHAVPGLIPQSKETGYIIMENIAPSISMADLFNNDYRTNNEKLGFDCFNEDVTLKDYLIILSQVCLALKTAYTDLKFTHYDLNTSNVMIRKGEPGSYIKYGEGIKYYVKSDFVATIIDFGYSHIVYKGAQKLNLGIFNMRNNSIMHDKEFPMHDVYKFYMFSMLLMRTSRPELFEELKPIFEFFNEEEEIEYCLEEQRKAFYALPYTKSNASVYHGDFINFIKRKYRNINFIESKPQKILDCNNYTCNNIKDFNVIEFNDLNVLYNLKAQGNDISQYEQNYLYNKNGWIDHISQKYQDFNDTYNMKNYQRALFLSENILADIKILNSLSETYESKDVYSDIDITSLITKIEELRNKLI